MANIQIAGFRPWGTLAGGEGDLPRPMLAEVANNYSTQISKYDIIKAVSDGTVAQAGSGDTALLGVCTGAWYTGSGSVIGGKRQPSDFLPANTTFSPTTVGSPNASIVQFIPLTGNLILEVVSVDTTFNTAAGQIGARWENCNLKTSGTASTTIGVSNQYLDITSHVTSAAQFRIVDIIGYTEAGFDVAMNDPTAKYFAFLVMCNQGTLPPYSTSGT
jgi:hypothetical protein